MEVARAIYIAMALVSIVPLILFNIRRIWVRRPPEPMKFKPVRFTVILLICVGLGGFLFAGYQVTLHTRYEIATERAAAQHAQVLAGKSTMEDFRQFVLDNGTGEVADSFDKTAFPAIENASHIRFQISKQCVSRFWKDKEGFEQAELDSDDNPIYVMYRMEADGEQFYIAMRLRRIEDNWKYEWIGNATDKQISTIEMPTVDNGKWFTVK